MEVKGNVIIYGNNIEHIENYYEHPGRLEGAESTPTGGKSFGDFISPDADSEHVVEVLRMLIEGKRGKDVALVMQCAMEKGWLIGKPTFNSIVLEFGDIGSESNFYEYMKFIFTDQEKAPILKLLK